MGEKIYLGTVHEIPRNDHKVFQLDVIDILVCNVNDNFYAMSNYCPHMGVVISRGPLDKNILTCPGHGYKFDVTTGECFNDKELRLPKFNLIREGDSLYVSF